MFIKALYAILVLSIVLLLGVAAACYMRYRRHVNASDAALRSALEQIEQERGIGKRR